MPDELQTLRELLAGMSSMQMHMGLTPISMQFGGGFQPMATPPAIKHPGQFSQEVMQQSMQQIASTVQTTQQAQQVVAPGEYSRQYRQRMAQIESGYMTPFQAQFYAGAQGAGGAGAGAQNYMGLPSPIFQTAPTTGIYRQTPQIPAPLPLARERPYIQTPFTPAIPPPMFQPAIEMAYEQQRQRQEMFFAGGMASIPTAVGLGGAGLTAYAGARLGGRFGRLGRMGGFIGGAALGFGAVMPGLESLTENLVTNPAVQMRAFGNQMQQISRNFVAAGMDLDPVYGQGLTPQAALQLTQRMQRGVARREMGGFNMRDMMRLTSIASETGMLDMAQNGDQIYNQMRNISRGLRQFMRIAQEPDVRNAMQQMASFRQMGLTIPETMVAQQNTMRFARMAGMSQSALAEVAGRPGAFTFQQLGMTAGLGFQVGTAAGGMAGQAIAGGAFTPGQLAMAGGRSGLTQNITEAAAAGIGVDFPLLAALTRGRNGLLQIDPSRVSQIMSGSLSLGKQAQLGDENVTRLGGERAITELSTRLNELRDQLGRVLGPQGSALYTMRQAVNMQREVPGLTFGAALRTLGLNEQQARSMELMGQSEGFWGGLRRQNEVSIRRARFDEAERLRSIQGRATWYGQLGSWWDRPGVFARAGEAMTEGLSNWFMERGRAEDAAGAGLTYVQRAQQLELRDPRLRAQSRQFVRGGGLESFLAQNRGLAAPGRPQDITGGEMAGAAWNIGLGTATAIGVGALTGGLGLLPTLAIQAGAAGLTDYALGSTAPRMSSYAQALRTTGGFAGALTEFMPSLTVGLGAFGGRGEADRARRAAEDAAALGRDIEQSRSMSTNYIVEMMKPLRKYQRDLARSMGLDVKETEKVDAFNVLVNTASEVFKDNTIGFDKATRKTEIQKRGIEALVKSGWSRGMATRYVRDRWDAGLGGAVINQAEKEGDEEVKAGIAKTQSARGYEGALAGVTLKNAQDRLKELDDSLRKTMVGREGLFSGIGDETYTQLKETLLSTQGKDADLQFLALQAVGADAGIKGQLQKALQEMAPGKAAELLVAARERFAGMSDDQKEALRRSGFLTIRQGQVGASGRAGAGVTGISAPLMMEHIEKMRRTAQGTAALSALQTGATKLAESVLPELRGVSLDVAGISEVMRRVSGDKGRMGTLTKTLSPELMSAIKRFGKAGEGTDEQKQAVRDFQAALMEGGETTGGLFGGTGGATEETLRRQQKVRDQIESAIKKGDSSKAFSAAVPAFHEASTSLLKSAQTMDGTMAALRMKFKLV